MVFYCFTFGILGREIGNFPFGILQEGIMLLGWLTLIFAANKYDWDLINNDICILMLIWFIISILEIGNPAGASIQGWLQEIRAAAMYPCLVVPMAFLLMKNSKDLNTFLYLILGLSLLASLNGLKQLYIGPSPGEQRFLDEGGAITHILWGRLRVFSFYSDAGQFGASQAHIGLMALILCLGPFKFWKKLVLFIISMIMIYGMLISGTRGALFALVVGVFTAILLSKKFKVIIIGGIIALSLLFVLKYTNIGSGNYQILRLRSALDPKEASFNVRLNSQRILREYLSSMPFGGGLGVIGVWGEAYNKDKFLSTIQPDSYWVKVWAMYGIVGFTIWFGIMMYILGRCCGIVWNIKDDKLKVKAMALTAGYAGILFCSYGNEVINTAPSSFVVYFSWVFVLMCPMLEKQLEEQKNKDLNLS
ncbi:O-antigen ligase [Pedobacter sp. L105]|uniref:O-antigen ligase family protein n=1 Tax=Pedobacter sp. L105 TaxID=1641871 RepID=UPI0020B11946|nr:O-antigen ligase family protein [Pedobacter sp. L105]